MWGYSSRTNYAFCISNWLSKWVNNFTVPLQLSVKWVWQHTLTTWINCDNKWVNVCDQTKKINSDRENPGGKGLCIQNGFEKCAVNKAWEHTKNNKENQNWIAAYSAEYSILNQAETLWKKKIYVSFSSTIKGYYSCIY